MLQLTFNFQFMTSVTSDYNTLFLEYFKWWWSFIRFKNVGTLTYVKNKAQHIVCNFGFLCSNSSCDFMRIWVSESVPPGCKGPWKCPKRHQSCWRAWEMCCEERLRELRLPSVEKGRLRGAWPCLTLSKIHEVTSSQWNTLNHCQENDYQHWGKPTYL